MGAAVRAGRGVRASYDELFSPEHFAVACRELGLDQHDAKMTQVADDWTSQDRYATELEAVQYHDQIVETLRTIGQVVTREDQA